MDYINPEQCDLVRSLFLYTKRSGDWMAQLDGRRIENYEAFRTRNKDLPEQAGRQQPIPGSSQHPAADLSTPSEAVIRDERLRRFWQAMERLDPLDRDMIRLRRLENLSNKEVARKTGLTDGGATKRLQRAEQCLAEIIRGLLESKESMW